MQTVEAYDLATGTWTTRAPLPFQPGGSFGVGAAAGRLYVIGYDFGNGHIRAEAYDPGTNQWTTTAAPPTARYAFAVSASNGLIYVVGGTDASPLGTVEVYDPGGTYHSGRCRGQPARRCLHRGRTWP